MNTESCKGAIPWEVIEGFRECPAGKGEPIQCAEESKTLDEAIQRYESFYGESISKVDFLLRLSEALEGCEESYNVKLATDWADKWFFYYNKPQFCGG